MMHTRRTTSKQPGTTAVRHAQVGEHSDDKQVMTRESSRRQTLRLTAGGGMAVTGAALAGLVTTGNAAAAREAGIVGSWINSGIPPAGAGPSFKSLATYTADGGLVNSHLVFLTPAPPPPQMSTGGHGAWVQTGRRTFVTTLVLLQHDENSTLLASIKVVGHVTLDRTGGAYTAVFNITIFSPTGGVVATRTDTGTASRIRVHPLHSSVSVTHICQSATILPKTLDTQDNC